MPSKFSELLVFEQIQTYRVSPSAVLTKSSEFNTVRLTESVLLLTHPRANEALFLDVNLYPLQQLKAHFPTYNPF